MSGRRKGGRGRGRGRSRGGPANKPLSGKQKKQQMKQARAAKARQEAKLQAAGADYWEQQGWTDADWKDTEKENPKETIAKPERSDAANDSEEEETPEPYIGRSGRRPPRLYYDPNKLRTVFASEPKAEIEKRKFRSQRPLRRRKDYVFGEDEGFYYTEIIDMPVRPAWSYSMSKRQLLKNEEKYFRKYLEDIYSRYPVERLNYFEHNLEVWRQLWRTCERSDILLVVADCRHPMFNFPPSLYRYITQTLQKPMLLVLNKVDLIPRATLDRWISYFQTTYPSLRVATFTSFPQAETVTAEGLNPARKRDPIIRKGKVPYGIRHVYEHCKEIIQAYDLGKHIGGVDRFSLGSKHQADNQESLRAIPKQEKFDSESLLTRLEAPLQSTSLEAVKEVEDHSRIYSDEDEETDSDTDEDTGTDEEEESGTRQREQHKPAQPRARKNNKFITLGLLGHPNAGKSSLVNALMRKKLASVSKTPGHTKHFQTLFLNKFVRLCDCPGLVFPALDMPKPLQILCGLYPIAQVREPYSSVEFLAERIPLEEVFQLHPVDVSIEDRRSPSSYDWSAYKLCEAYAKYRNYRVKNGGYDVYRAGNEILRFAHEGRIILYFEPPEQKDPQAAAAQGPPPETDS